MKEGKNSHRSLTASVDAGFPTVGNDNFSAKLPALIHDAYSDASAWDACVWNTFDDNFDHCFKVVLFDALELKFEATQCQ